MSPNNSSAVSSAISLLIASVTLVALIGMVSCSLGTYHSGGEQSDVDAGSSVPPGTRFHPTNFAMSSVHGPEFNLQKQNCASCHGDDLAGKANATSCDSCHTPASPQAWRSDCVFCHGGELDQTGAPPSNLDGTVDVGAGTFPPHVVHVNSGNTVAGFDCVQCHTKATDVLSIGHAIDSTAGVAEVDLGAGLSGKATYSRATGCIDTYCHGNGRGDNGNVTVASGTMTCTSCHPNQTSTSAALDEMSGSHRLHLGITDVKCGECHSQTSTDGNSITNLAMHVNGKRDVSFIAAGFSMDATEQTCTGTCHGRDHQGLLWSGANGRFHPDNFAEADAHGPEMELQRINCRGCHGADLTGQNSAPSCDSCHDANNPTAWRTDCTFCHGGDDTAGGAPPRDLGSGVDAASLSFRAHTVHVTQGIAAALDCTVCHTKPTDVLSPGHAFDNTVAMAEVKFSGLAQGANYNAGTCSAVYCHGNGRNNGTITDGSPARACNSCHPGINSNNQWGQMSGRHRKHLKEGVKCDDCHRSVTANSTSIINPLLHVNKKNEIDMSNEPSITLVSNQPIRCDGPCHGENHKNESW